MTDAARRLAPRRIGSATPRPPPEPPSEPASAVAALDPRVPLSGIAA
jgi:hypothetical protein